MSQCAKFIRIAFVERLHIYVKYYDSVTVSGTGSSIHIQTKPKVESTRIIAQTTRNDARTCLLRVSLVKTFGITYL